MNVFVFKDDDGNIGVYDVDSYNQVQKVFGKVISDLCGDPEEIKNMDVYDVMNYMQEQLGVRFNKKHGQYHVLEIKKQMDQLVVP